MTTANPATVRDALTRLVQNGPVTHLAFSQSGTMMGHRTRSNDLVVYQVSDGKEHAKYALTGVPALPFGPGGSSLQSFLVRDDGNLVVVRTANMLFVFEKTPSGTTTRRILVDDPEGASLGLGAQNLRLLADGSTFVDVTDAPRVRIWDLSRDPSRLAPPPYVRAAQPVERNGQQFYATKSEDGRLALEWPVGRTTGPISREAFTGPIVVRRSGRLSVACPTRRCSALSARTLADGHRLLVHYGPPREAGTSSWVWRLYDLDQDLREIAGSRGTLTGYPGVLSGRVPRFGSVGRVGPAPTGFRPVPRSRRRAARPPPGRVPARCSFRV